MWQKKGMSPQSLAICSLLIRYDSIVNGEKGEELRRHNLTLAQFSEEGFSGDIPGLFGFLLTRRFHPNRLQEKVEALYFSET
jgi:hypothetical protein